MRASQFFITTLKDSPADAEVVSQQLMLRAGLIRRLAAGIYTWMPMGLRVLRKVEAIIREEMNRAGAVELFMPCVQPAELWQDSGRLAHYGPELLRFKDRHDRDFVIGPTHEEVITDIVRREIKSYRQLPRHFYQIQTKFRDEIRPRFGIMRGREFTMKDAYSFHASFEDLEREYRHMHETYGRIFHRLGLSFRAVAADTGSIGGEGSHEFHVLADSGEDAIAWCPQSDYAANVELAPALPPKPVSLAHGPGPLRAAPTPGISRCEAVATHLNIPLSQIIKSIALIGPTGFVLALLRADHSLNPIKLSKQDGLKDYRLATPAEIKDALGAPAGFIGPVGIPEQVRLVVDHAALALHCFVCGANQIDTHWVDAQWGRDLPMPTQVADIRNVVAGDPSPDGQGALEICRGIEVGHIFQLRTKYSQALQCQFIDEQGRTAPMEMGCYGIGVTRIVGAAIEQNNDARGMIFPEAMAPFSLVIVPLSAAKSAPVREAAEQIYAQCLSLGIDVILDDRNERPGVMLADWELIGIPWRIVIGERTLKTGAVEVQARRDEAPTTCPLDALADFLRDRVGAP
jgi:prolyl-tRNA synthetase